MLGPKSLLTLVKPCLTQQQRGVICCAGFNINGDGWGCQNFLGGHRFTVAWMCCNWIMVLQHSIVSGKQMNPGVSCDCCPCSESSMEDSPTHQNHSGKIHGLAWHKIQLKQMFSKLYSLLSSKLLCKATETLLVIAACCIKSVGPTISSEVSNSKSNVNHCVFFLHHQAPRGRVWVHSLPVVRWRTFHLVHLPSIISVGSELLAALC